MKEPKKRWGVQCALFFLHQLLTTFKHCRPNYYSLFLTGLKLVVVKFVAPIVVANGLLGLLGIPPGLQDGELL